MSRYIDADALVDFINPQGTLRSLLEMHYSKRDVIDMIDSRPTADVVEVVRCEECRYWENRFDVMVCNLTDGMKGASDYCSYGERREDELHK